MPEKDYFDSLPDWNFLEPFSKLDLNHLSYSTEFSGNQSKEYYLGFISACRVAMGGFSSDFSKEEIKSTILEIALCAEIIASKK